MARCKHRAYRPKIDIRQQAAYNIRTMTQKKTDEAGLELVLAKVTRAQLAKALEIKRQNLTRWKRVPPHHVAKVAELTGIPREDILPSLYAS